MNHEPNDPIIGDERHGAFLIQYRFLTILSRLAYARSAVLDDYELAMTFVAYICTVYDFPEEQQNNIMQLAQNLYQYIDLDRVYNTAERVVGLSAAGVPHKDIVKQLDFRSKSMVNYHLNRGHHKFTRTHLKNWGQYTDLVTFMTAYDNFTEALNGHGNKPQKRMLGNTPKLRT